MALLVTYTTLLEISCRGSIIDTKRTGLSKITVHISKFYVTVPDEFYSILANSADPDAI